MLPEAVRAENQGWSLQHKAVARNCSSMLFCVRLSNAFVHVQTFLTASHLKKEFVSRVRGVRGGPSHHIQNMWYLGGLWVCENSIWFKSSGMHNFI